jgi:2-(1,2-epoxy-1,2-dihydrophenyl)acetyl-CoA isomerase
MSRATAEVLALEIDDGVAVITPNRPEVLNAFNQELGARLNAALCRAKQPDVRVVLITGGGKASSAGADLESLGVPEAIAGVPEAVAGVPDLERALIETFNRPVRLIRDLEKPVVAVVNGPAVGIALSYPRSPAT